MLRCFFLTRLTLRAVCWAATLLSVPGAVAGIEMRVEPGHERLRPYETAVIEVVFTGADRAAGVAFPGAVSLQVAEKDGGWLSRPFRYQPPGDSQAPPTVAVLYTAPGMTGRYTVGARFKTIHLRVAIGVSPSAPAHRLGESVSFGPESGARDFYRDLAEHYAPFVCQETWFEPKADFLTRFDYDGDWRGDNNWDDLATGSSQAYVHYTAMETSTHFFLVYDFLHPRHYSDECSSGGCYENDSNGLILTVRKDGSKYGRIEVMQTTSQNNLYTYVADRRLREGAHRIDGTVALWHDSHPMVFIEAGGHGVSSASDAARSRFSPERMEFTASTGVTYKYGGLGARPRCASDREVSYELLSAYGQWWPRATSANSSHLTFADPFRYAPFGNRPQATAEEIPAAFLGRKYAANQARPFWSWYDAATLSRKLLATGQLALDPAYAVWSNLRFPSGAPFSLRYIYNPYLEGSGPLETITALPPQSSPDAAEVAGLGAATAGQAGGRPPSGRNRQVLSPPAEKPNYKLKDKSGQLDFRARVDGEVYLLIHGDQIEVEYLNGRPMDEIRYRFSQPLPAQDLDEVKLEDVDGRGSVRLLEWPNDGNQYTAKVRIQDEKAGAGAYRFKLVWKR